MNQCQLIHFLLAIRQHPTPNVTILGKKIFYDSKIDLVLIFVSKRKIKKILFQREIWAKIVFSSPNAINGMLTSLCDNQSTHQYHLTYHPCFDMQFRHNNIFGLSVLIKQTRKQFVLFPIHFITILTQLLSSRQALLPFEFLFHWWHWQLRDSLPCMFGFTSIFLVVFVPVTFFPFLVSLGISNAVLASS